MTILTCVKCILGEVCCYSVALTCLTLCKPMNCSILGPPSSPISWSYSNSYPLSQWCSLTISFFVAPFSFCLQSFPVSGSFPVSQLFTSGWQSIGASSIVLPMNIQGWFPLGLTALVLLKSKELRTISNGFTSTSSRSYSPLVPKLG